LHEDDLNRKIALGKKKKKKVVKKPIEYEGIESEYVK
jgi:hypothetical protein